jgi:hypothetical protein
MLRIRRLPWLDVKAYVLRDVDRTCRCGRYPSVCVAVAEVGPEAARRELLKVRWQFARDTLAATPPCDHGQKQGWRRRHQRRTGRD